MRKDYRRRRYQRSEDERDRARRLVEIGKITERAACQCKQAYPNKNDARHAAKELGRRLDRIVDTYTCPFCHNYHITKRPYGQEDAA